MATDSIDKFFHIKDDENGEMSILGRRIGRSIR
jgi:hypothetical protein